MEHNVINPNNEEKEVIIIFRSKSLEKGSEIIDCYLKGYFILNRSQRVN
jgi:hypothetical protein